MESLPLAKTAIMDCQITKVVRVFKYITWYKWTHKHFGRNVMSILSELANGRLKIQNRTNNWWPFLYISLLGYHLLMGKNTCFGNEFWWFHDLLKHEGPLIAMQTYIWCIQKCFNASNTCYKLRHYNHNMLRDNC